MQKTYAIGDIHGCLDELRVVVARCERDAAGTPAKFVFIGDYIDRGPDSRGVVDFIIGLQAKLGSLVCLRGNHEALLLAALDSSVNAGQWLLNGGDATLRSYGVASATDLPAAHVRWFRSLLLEHDDGQRLFVHAGIDPRKPFDAQDEHDLMWIREPFLSDRRDHGRLVVHGHTPIKSGPPELKSNRLNIDTGAVYGNALTAAIFTSGQRDPLGFIQADA